MTICEFIGLLRNPETLQPFMLFAVQERFLNEAFTPLPDGRLPYAELIFGAPKKTGKTWLAAVGLLYVVRVLCGRFAEGYAAANDLEQSTSRVFRQCARLVEASPILSRESRVLSDRIIFEETGGTITALANDYAGAAGGNPNITAFDELWGYTSERARRLWDEMVPVPTRTISLRLTTTYAGFSGESGLLEKLYQRGLQGEQIAPDLYRQPGKMLMYWSHEPVAPWQTPEWIAQMREQLRPNAFLRMIENRWVTSESSFVDMAEWDACTDSHLHPIGSDPTLPVWVGVDASISRDATAIVAMTGDTNRARLVWHRIFQPSREEPLDFEGTIARTLRELCQRFSVQAVRYDPFQMVAVAQRLRSEGWPMEAFPQTVPNLTEASTNLYELIRTRGLIAYPDAAIRKSVSQAVAVETSRGWRITKEKASHKIDVVVALAMAALACVRAISTTEPGLMEIGEGGLANDQWTEFLDRFAEPFGPPRYGNPFDHSLL